MHRSRALRGAHSLKAFELSLEETSKTEEESDLFGGKSAKAMACRLCAKKSRYYCLAHCKGFCLGHKNEFHADCETFVIPSNLQDMRDGIRLLRNRIHALEQKYKHSPSK